MIAGRIVIGRFVLAHYNSLMKRRRHFHAMRLVGRVDRSSNRYK